MKIKIKDQLPDAEIFQLVDGEPQKNKLREIIGNGKTVLSGLRPDSQRYFEYHHTANDTFEAINKRELELGAAAMTSMIYLVDQYGL